MRRLLIIFVVVMFCSASGWADSTELDVSAWATFTATQPCSSNCTETIGMDFLYDPPTLQTGKGGIVPGTLSVSSSGFLGMLSSPGWGYYYAPLFDGLSHEGAYGDEIDLVGTCSFCADALQIAPGINTLSFSVYSCGSAACYAAFGPDATGTYITPTSEFTVATPVHVPDGDSYLLLSLSAFGAFALAWRWRRREV